MLSRRHHVKVAAAFLLAALAAASCKDTKTQPEPEPEIETLRLTVGGASAATITVASNPGCAVTGGPITIHQNVTTTISASFRNAAGDADPVANDPATFRLSGSDNPHGSEPAPTPATITWTRTGPFAGTLRGTATTTTGSVQFSAFHIGEGHEDWGPCAVPITVAP
jgi:hypothetical protein